MNNELNEINKKNYKTLTPFKGWVIENFPFIEADFDAITNYQLICKVTEYLNTVIYNQTQVQNLSNELVDGYNNLLKYVNDYFDNLDVQDEINNKLDDLVNDGTLTTLIGNYVNPIQEAFEARIENQIDTINTKVNASVGIQPIPVSSVEDMTNTSKVYVNTIDGYWYYYNGTNWVQGGIYQSTSNTADVTSLKNQMYDINGNMVLDDLFEIGNITISNQEWTYTNSTTRVRTKEDVTISLKTGDTVEITNSDIQFYCGYLMANSKYETLENAWLTDGFTCRCTGDYVMVLRFAGEQEAIASPDEIVKYIKIHRNNINQLPIVNKIVNSNYIKQYIIEGMDQGGYDVNQYQMYSYGKIQTIRMAHKEVILSDRPIVVEALDGYMVAAQRWTSATKSSETLLNDSGWHTQIIINPNEYTSFMIKNSTNTAITDLDFNSYLNIYYLEDKEKIDFKNSIIKSVNHRGYNSIAPENTIPAFKLSKENGFDIIETDVRLTSDNVLVLLHDATIDRTSNGEGAIASMTYEQALQYDFGSWKSETYAGTKIPTLEELIALARKINLHCYLELEADVNFTQTIINNMISMIDSYQMLDKVTFISFNRDILLLVKNANKNVRIGYLPNNNENYMLSINKVQSLKTANNEVFYDGDYTAYNDNKRDRLKLCNIPYEVWVPYTASQILNMDPYVSGFTTNVLNAEEVLYNNSIN